MNEKNLHTVLYNKWETATLGGNDLVCLGAKGVGIQSFRQLEDVGI